jgi:hypothetical protein
LLRRLFRPRRRRRMVSLHAVALTVKYGRINSRLHVTALGRSQLPPERQLWGLVQSLLAPAAPRRGPRRWTLPASHGHSAPSRLLAYSSTRVARAMLRPATLLVRGRAFLGWRVLAGESRLPTNRHDLWFAETSKASLVRHSLDLSKSCSHDSHSLWRRAHETLFFAGSTPPAEQTLPLRVSAPCHRCCPRPFLDHSPSSLVAMRLSSPSGSPRLLTSRSRTLSPRPLPRLPLTRPRTSKGRAVRVFLAGGAAALAAVALLIAFSTVRPGTHTAASSTRVSNPRFLS